MSRLESLQLEMDSAPYSSSNPPNAPKKGKRTRKPLRIVIPTPGETMEFKETEETKEEWVKLKESGMVHPKFLQYNPEDILEIDDIDTLLELRGWYFPSSQPRNFFEAAYISLMHEAIEKRLYMF